MASEDCGYSVESVAVHISLERYYSYQTMFYLAVYQTSMMQKPRGFDSLNPHLTQQVVNRIRFSFYVCWSLIVCEDGEGFFVAFLETKPNTLANTPTNTLLTHYNALTISTLQRFPKVS